MERIRGVVITEYAGFWIRFVAYLIDAVILVFAYWVFNAIWGLASGKGMFGGSTDVFALATGTDWLLGIIVFFLIGIAYLVCFWGWRGQTPGKMIMRVKVLRTDGSEIGWGIAVFRYLGYVISGLLFGLGYFWVAFDVDKRGIHDKIADTAVVKLTRQ